MENDDGMKAGDTISVLFVCMGSSFFLLMRQRLRWFGLKSGYKVSGCLRIGPEDSFVEFLR